MHTTKALISMLGLILASTAFADTTHPAMDSIGAKPQQMTGGQMQNMMMSRFKQSDTDHNDAISKAEATNMPMLEQHFDQVDTNHDGQVSMAEMQAAFQQQMQSGNKPKN